MMETTPGYTALHESAAWLDLSHRGRLRVTGSDRVRLLHAMVSNDVRSLAPGQGNYNFLLDAHGHILADAWLYLLIDSILLDLEPEVAGRVVQHLNRHIIADDVQVENVTGTVAAVALEGPHAEEIAGMSVPAESGAHVESDGVIVARVSATRQPGLRFFLDPANKTERVARFEKAGAVAATAEDFRTVRVENGLPRYGEDFDETSLPHETQQLQAVSFNKGCYLGQEIVERVRARGQVHKLLVKVALKVEESASKAALEGCPVLAGGQEVGRFTSPVYSPRLGRWLGFAILRREFSQPGTPVMVGIHSGQVAG